MHMDLDRLKRTVERIETLDRDRFVQKLSDSLDPSGEQAVLAAAIAPSFLQYIRMAPDLLDLVALWAGKVDLSVELAPLIQMAEAYFRRPDDEIDEQRHGLFGLLDDAYLVGKLVEQCVKAGMPLPEEVELDKLNGLAAILLGEQIVDRLHSRLAAALPAQPAPAPAPAQPLQPQVDRRLVGLWHHSTYYSSDGFSYSNTRSRLFTADGRYAEGSQSFADMVHRDSGGYETGRSAANAVGTDSRGRWQVSGTLLTLEADNGDVYEFRLEVYPRELLLSQPGRDPQLWTRG
jgi:hypothetical protein